MVWDKIAKIGIFTDMSGNTHYLTNEIFNRVVADFKSRPEKVPLVIGHPSTDSPAYGWIDDLRVKDGFLEARYESLSAHLKKAVAEGTFRYKSIALDNNLTRLRHLGVLGGVAPAVGGLGSIQLQEQDNSVILYFADNMKEDIMTLEELAAKVKQQQEEIDTCKQDIDALKRAIAAGGASEASFSSPNHYEISGSKIASKL